MITLDNALEIIRKSGSPLKTETVDLLHARGRVLAQPVFSDVDMPPFNKSAMDGYACRKADLTKILKVIEYIPAGTVPVKSVGPGTCSKIMTGGMVPQGADCVIMVEHTETTGNNLIKYLNDRTKDNICYRGEDVKKEDCVLRKGTLLKPQHIAILASAGKTEVKTFIRPKISLIATGDEIVEPEKIPGISEIRNSNSYNLLAQIRQTGIEAEYQGIVRDDPVLLTKAIKNTLNNADMLILTGGVSMGDKDFVPGILQSVSLELKFSRLAVQPGKPVAFAAGNSKYCFGLSGNPVSSLLQFELLVRPLIYQLMGHDYKLPFIKTKLENERQRKNTDRMQFFPVEIREGIARIIEFHGSAHIVGLDKAGGFGVFEQGSDTISPSDEIRILLLPP